MYRRLFTLLFLLFAMYGALHGNENHHQLEAIVLTDDERGWIDQGHTVRVRVSSWPPFQFNDEGFSGISVEYITKILEQHGIKYEFVSGKDVSWNQALLYIRDHRVVDLILTAKITEERKEAMLFTDEYLFLPWVIFSRVDSPYIQNIYDLEGKTVSVPKGFVMQKFLENEYPKIKLKVFSEGDAVETCLLALAEAQVDAYIGNLTVGSYVIQKKGYSNVKVAAPTPFGSHNQAMAVRDDWPELVSIINKTLAAMSSEEKAVIRNKWLAVRYEHGLRFRDLVKWVGAVSSFFLLVLLVSLYWNRKLKQEINYRIKAEEKLQASESRYRSLSGAAFEAICIIDKGYILDVNELAGEIFGFTPGEMIGMKAIEFIAPSSRDIVTENIQNEYDKPYEALGLKKSGETFPVEIQGKMFYFEGHRARVTAVRDLSEVKRAEAEIHDLRGILPICSHCKKIRDDRGYWNNLEAYLHSHSLAEFSHGLCPDCMKKLYPDIDIESDDE